MKAVTTLHEKDVPTIGKRLFESWQKHSGNIELLVLLDNLEPVKNLKYKNVRFIKFSDVYYREFLEEIKNRPEFRGLLPDGRYEYRRDAYRFCHKIFAIAEAKMYLEKTDDILFWWDSDALLTSKLTKNFIKSNLSPIDWVAAYLGRKDWDHSETGVIFFNMKHELAIPFIMDMKRTYYEGHFTKLNSWIDSSIFDFVRSQYETNFNAKFKNISDGIGGKNVWEHTFLGKVSVHHIGVETKQKEFGTTPGALQELAETLQNTRTEQVDKYVAPPSLASPPNNRYEQIFSLMTHFKPAVITEIGVARGDRAEQMIRTAATYANKIIYFGFDLFEDLDEETKKKELNEKEVWSRERVAARLRNLQKKIPGLAFNLYKGNTNETLKKYVNEKVEVVNGFGEIINISPAESHMVFIDGGHSIETIRNDYSYFKHVPLIIMDDYYVPDQHGRIPDTEKYGCNKLVEELSAYKVFPKADPIVNGGLVQIVVTGELSKKILINTNDQGQQRRREQIPDAGEIKGSNFSVKTRNSVPNEMIQENVEYNCKKMIEHNIPHLPVCKLHDNIANMIGGAESYKKSPYIDMIREAMYKDNEFNFVAKTSHDWLLSKGIVPDACILLDPRPHVARSFDPDPRVTYIMASQCHPDVIDKLLKAKARIYVYHAAVLAGEDEVVRKYFPNAPILPGGSTSQTRGMVALSYMGFYRFRIFGNDCYYKTMPKVVHGINQDKKPIEIEVKNKVSGELVGGRKWITDPEFLAQINDFEMLIKTFPHWEIECCSEGLLGAMFESWKKTDTRREFDPTMLKRSR